MGHEAARRLALVEALDDRVGALNDYLFEDLGFHGNEDRYDDPRNSFLNDVLVRRTGIPISLATVYLDVGRRAGLRLEGVNFPGHFLVRALGAGSHEPDLLIDVFHRGAILREIDCQRLLERHAGGEVVLSAEVLATADVRQTLARMATNLKRLYVRSRSFPQALDVTHLLVALDETATVELRDRGLLAYQLKRFPEALRDLERYLRLISPPFVTGTPAAPPPAESAGGDEDDDDRKEYEQIWEHVKTLRRRVAGFN
jgi:regulator of sirC expression with transglutaminase-like and TPR domain